MPLIGLVNDEDGTNKTLEDALGLFSVATSGAPSTFEPTIVRGALAIVPAGLPSNPTTGTLAVDISAGNMLKWWDGDEWRDCSSEIISGGGGGSGIGAGQTINLQQGLPANITIATSGPLQSIIANEPLPQGLVLNESTGQITGTPEVFGNYSVSMTATFTDSTVATDDVGFSIAQAFPITFTFDESDLSCIAAGDYVNSFLFSYTPYPNPLPITWSVLGYPNGMYSYSSGVGNMDRYIYGEPSTAGTYQVTVSATNWVGTTTKTFTINVFTYNIEVYGTSYDGIYTPSLDGYYTYENGNVDVRGGYPTTHYISSKIYEHESNSDLKVFFFDPYGSWVIEDMSSYYSGLFAPTYVIPNASTLPPENGWFDPNPQSSVTISYIQPDDACGDGGGECGYFQNPEDPLNSDYYDADYNFYTNTGYSQWWSNYHFTYFFDVNDLPDYCGDGGGGYVPLCYTYYFIPDGDSWIIDSISLSEENCFDASYYNWYYTYNSEVCYGAYYSIDEYDYDPPDEPPCTVPDCAQGNC